MYVKSRCILKYLAFSDWGSYILDVSLVVPALPSVTILGYHPPFVFVSQYHYVLWSVWPIGIMTLESGRDPLYSFSKIISSFITWVFQCLITHKLPQWWTFSSVQWESAAGISEWNYPLNSVLQGSKELCLWVDSLGCWWTCPGGACLVWMKITS